MPEASPHGRILFAMPHKGGALSAPDSRASRGGPAVKSESSKHVVKIVPLGGLEEIGRNMTYLEYGDDIIVVDIGIGFPEAESMPGIDYIIPNIEILKAKKHKIRGILLTHGHFDHIGALPYLLDALGNPPVYATPLTRAIVLRRQQDFPDSPKLKIFEIKKEEEKRVKLGEFVIEWFHVNHNIPDSVGFMIRTPQGNILHTGDFKIDFTPVSDKPADLSRIVRIAQDGVDLMMADSTNSCEPGHVVSESEIMKNLDDIFEDAPGRIIAATFASLLERIQQVIWLSEKYGRKVVIEGYSMKTNFEVAKELEYIKAKKFTVVSPHEALKMEPHKVTVVCTGAQGEDRAVLMRVVNGEHKFFKIKEGDTVIFSSSVIPGNERSVQYLKDSLYRQGARVFHYQMMDIHASGHAHEADLRLMANIIQPKFYLPIHGHYYMLKRNAEILESLGMARGNTLVAENGHHVELAGGKAMITGTVDPANHVYVDGLGVGDIGEVVLRDRQILSQDGIFFVVTVIDSQTGRLRTSPDIIARGFVYVREAKDLMKDTRDLVKKVMSRSIRFRDGSSWPIINEDHIKANIKEEVGQFLFDRTHRRPMVIPVLIQV